MFKKFLLFLCLLVVIGAIASAGVIYWGYLYITRDLPNFSTVDDYRPNAVTRVYARDGTLIAEFYKERRYPAKLAEIPQIIKDCFLAAEDASFYKHSGIDPTSIVRAALKNFESGSSKQGGSTITQQVVKNLLLTSEKNIKRKAKEAILAYRLEKRLSKDGILEIYLNQIFFGNSAYGIKAAGRIYFHKELSELTLGEGALLASLPKAPSAYSPLRNMARAKRRQRYVLNQMVKAGFISQEQADEAFDQKISVYEATPQNIYHAPYYVTEIRNVFREKWKNIDLDAEGLEIHTPLDLTADNLARSSLQSGLRVVDKRRGWRGPLSSIPGANREVFREKFQDKLMDKPQLNELYPAMILSVSKLQQTLLVDLGDKKAVIDLKETNWIKKKVDKENHTSFIRLEETLRPGDVIEVSVDEKKGGEQKAQDAKSPNGMIAGLKIDQTPDLEGAIILLNPNSGEIVTAIGGYSYDRSKFNRATQSLRQPGSAFKPIVYLAAVDGFSYTPATIVDDRPATYKVGDQYWSPHNFDEKYLGPITLQTALERSRNLVSAQIVSRIGLTPVITYAQKLGIRSPLGHNLSLSLGSSEVTMLELARAYGVFAGKGVLFDSVFIDRMVDRNGEVIYDYENDKLANAHQVISEESAFIMAHMMKGTIERGTAMVVKPIGRPVAGKTGTTNDQMDAWFVGYTPNWVCAIWVGFDQKKQIGEKETGGKVSAPIWLDFMKQYLNIEDKKSYDKLVIDAKEESERLGVQYFTPEKPVPLDFSVPDGLDPFWIDPSSGRVVPSDTPGALKEYFLKGTEPKQAAAPEERTVDSYLDSPDL